MKEEVQYAVNFLTNLVTNSSLMNAQQLEKFRGRLDVLLCARYKDHWFPDRPAKGSGYRCVRINHKMDPLLSDAAAFCGVAPSDLFAVFPNELTLWVDPRDVSYRFGEDGSIGMLYGCDDTSSTSSTPPSPMSVSPEPCQPDFYPHQAPALQPLQHYHLQQCGDQHRAQDLWEPLYHGYPTEFVN